MSQVKDRSKQGKAPLAASQLMTKAESTVAIPTAINLPEGEVAVPPPQEAGQERPIKIHRHLQ
jgi:hypothetical protein